MAKGLRQLLVGPASASRSEQMKVRSSTRATSAGSLRARKLLGRHSGFRRMRVPCCTIIFVSSSHSRVEPSHHTMLSGLVSRAMSRTQSFTSEFFEGPSTSTMVLVSRMLIVEVPFLVV